MAELYCIDASTILHMQWFYPPDVFGQLWAKFEEDAVKGLLITSEVVVDELGKKGDHASTFVKGIKDFGCKMDDGTLAQASAVLAKVPHIIDAQNTNPQADPYLIGLSIVRNAILVTQEKSAPNAKKAKIPDVCAQFNVPCITLLDLVRARSWKF